MWTESHAQSFAAIAYLSAYTRFHFRAAYTCALLNNQPMGFYSPATILNDAKRHGLKGLSIDVQNSEWFCTLKELRKQTAIDTPARSPSESASNMYEDCGEK
jgi:error-prone DNA polymerase